MSRSSSITRTRMGGSRAWVQPGTPAASDSTWRTRVSPDTPRGFLNNRPGRSSGLHLHGDEADALAGLDPEQNRLAPEVLGLLHAGLDIGRGGHRLALHFQDDVAGLETLGGGVGARVDIADLDAVLLGAARLPRRQRDAEVAQLRGGGRLRRWLLLELGQLLGSRKGAELDRNGLGLAVAGHLDLDGGIRRILRDLARELTAVGDLLAVDGDNGITGLEARAGGRSARRDLVDERTARLAEAET